MVVPLSRSIPQFLTLVDQPAFFGCGWEWPSKNVDSVLHRWEPESVEGERLQLKIRIPVSLSLKRQEASSLNEDDVTFF